MQNKLDKKLEPISTKILLVDSNLKYKRKLEKKLNDIENPFELLYVNSNVKFFNSVKEFNPDIVISEFKDTNINGSEVLEYIREQHRVVKVIITALEEREIDALKCLEKGAANYINKRYLKKIAFAIKKIIQKKDFEIELQKSKFKLYESKEDYKKNSILSLS